MMKPVLVNAHEVNRVLNYRLGNGSDWYGVKFEVTLDLLQSSLDHFDVKLTIEDEGGEFDFRLPLGAAEERFLDQLVEKIAKYPTFLDGTLTVLLWIEVKDKCTFDFPVVRSVKVSPRRRKDIDIIFGKRKSWTLLDLFQIQLWASTAQAGLHSRSATGMGVGGRRFGWLRDMGFTTEETEYLCRLNLGPNGLRKSGGVYVGNSTTEPLDDDDDDDLH